MAKHKKHRVSSKYYTSIGRIASGWAHFEVMVNHAIWELANVEQHAGACITAQIISPNARFKALVSLIQLRGGTKEAVGRLNTLSGKADGVARERNRIVHDLSAVHQETGEFKQLRITADRKLDFGFVPVHLHEMKAIERRISKLIKDCGKAIQDAIDELPAFDRTQFELSPGIRPDRRPAKDSGKPTQKRPPRSSRG